MLFQRGATHSIGRQRWRYWYRRLDIDFVPHVGVGNSKDVLKCIEMARRWNRQDFAICGHIGALDVVQFEDNSIRTLQRIFLSNQ